MFSAFLSQINGQALPRHVEYQELGLSFNIPNGWTGQANGEYVILGHNSITGMMILFENNSTSA